MKEPVNHDLVSVRGESCSQEQKLRSAKERPNR